MPALPRSTMTHLECSRCGKTHAHNRLQNLCTCGKPLLARYELKAAAKTLTREALTTRPANMWRYAEVLPGGQRDGVSRVRRRRAQNRRTDLRLRQVCGGA